LAKARQGFGGVEILCPVQSVLNGLELNGEASHDLEEHVALCDVNSDETTIVCDVDYRCIEGVDSSRTQSDTLKFPREFRLSGFGVGDVASKKSILKLFGALLRISGAEGGGEGRPQLHKALLLSLFEEGF
jgi:hypothetical protein